jgi:hypothetical protein
MKKVGRSNKIFGEMQLKLLEILAKEEIERSNILLTATLGYFFIVLYAVLTEAVERLYGVVLILTSIIIISYFLYEREKIARKYKKKIKKYRKKIDKLMVRQTRPE